MTTDPTMPTDPTYQRVCTATDIDPGTVSAVTVDNIRIALVRTQDDEYFAVYDACSHQHVALSKGEVNDCTLECSLHGSRFDLRTGEPTDLPAIQPVPVYPIEIRDGDIYLSLAPSNGVRP